MNRRLPCGAVWGASRERKSVLDVLRKPVTILIADDDPDDRMLALDALTESNLGQTIHFVEDGDELLDYLYQRGKYADPATATQPGLILLDLNMPRKDGRDTIREIRADAHFRHIPIIVLTTSSAQRDILGVYTLGANSFITKPVTFDGLVDVMQALRRYWIEIAELPSVDNEDDDL